MPLLINLFISLTELKTLKASNKTTVADYDKIFRRIVILNIK